MQLYNPSSERPRGTFISWLNPIYSFGPQLPHKSTREGSRWLLCISQSLQTPSPISAGCLFEPIEHRVRVMRQELSELPLTPLSRTASGVKKWLLASL